MAGGPAYSKKLGPNQRKVLTLLQERGGEWTKDSGWTFVSTFETVRVLGTLEPKGYVEKLTTTYPFGFKLTEKGQTA